MRSEPGRAGEPPVTPVRWRARGVLVAVIGLVALLALVAGRATGARGQVYLGPLVSAAHAPADLEALAADSIELVPSIRPPTSEDGRLRIVTYLRLPRESVLRARMNDGEAVVSVPSGARAWRIEARAGRSDDDVPSSRWRVLDVRTITLGTTVQQLQLLRPATAGAGELTGIAWPRTEEGRAQAAIAIERLFEARTFASSSSRPEERAADAAHLIALNDCASCHVASRREDRSPGTLVQKGTDASSLFHVLATLSDDGPIERYRPRDANAADRFVSLLCDGRAVPRTTALCKDGQRPSAHLDLEAGLRAGDAHARRVCTARLLLAGFMDDEGRRTFRAAIAPCRTLGPDVPGRK